MSQRSGPKPMLILEWRRIDCQWWMNANRCQPVELFNAVVDLVKSPQQGYRVKHPMCEIEAQISNQDDLDDLEPIRLAGDSDPHRRRDQPCGDDDAARNHD